MKKLEDTTPSNQTRINNGALDSTVYNQLRERDPEWTETLLQMSTNPWKNGVLTHRFIELVCIGLSATCTNLDVQATRRHIRAALDSGATQEEVLFVIKCCSVVAIHSCSLGAPILLEEANKTGVSITNRSVTDTPSCNKMKDAGL